MAMQNQDEEDFRFLAENSADMVCRVGLDLVMHYASPSCERLLGWKPEVSLREGLEQTVRWLAEHPEPATARYVI